MKKLRKQWMIALILLSSIAVCFYWFQLRPIKIRRSCSLDTLTAWRLGSYKKLSDEEYYAFCIRKHGLSE